MRVEHLQRGRHKSTTERRRVGSGGEWRSTPTSKATFQPLDSGLTWGSKEVLEENLGHPHPTVATVSSDAPAAVLIIYSPFFPVPADLESG